MTYDVTMEKDLKNKLDNIKSVNFREYTMLTREIEKIRDYALIMMNHTKKFNTFDKPLQDFKWVEFNDKILVFTLNPLEETIHLCDYLPKEEVFD
jgi:hypothetical protein